MSEHFLSGYCRQLDAARMVELEIENHEIEDVDCNYGECPFQTSCQIAQSIGELLDRFLTVP